jgi:hypothetical protein
MRDTTCRGDGRLHLLRRANVDGFLQAFPLVEVLEKVQGILRLAKNCSIFGGWFSLGNDFKIDAVFGIIRGCLAIGRALGPLRFGRVESLEKVPELAD